MSPEFLVDWEKVSIGIFNAFGGAINFLASSGTGDLMTADKAGMANGYADYLKGLATAAEVVTGDPIYGEISGAISTLQGIGNGVSMGMGVLGAARSGAGRFMAAVGAGRARSAGATAANATRGWKVGDPIKNLTSKGNVPSWDAVRKRYWKNQAFNNAGKYNPTDLARMRQGLAPQRVNEVTGKLESIHLHHDPPQSAGGLFGFKPMWPDEHAGVHAAGMGG